MNLFYIIGVAIIIICMIRGWIKGLANIVGSILATILSFLLFWAIRNWAFESFLATLLFNHSMIIVRVVVCLLLYTILFLLLKAIMMSLKIVTKLPIIRGMNRLLGLLLGGAYGVLLVGILTILYEWILQK